MTSVKTPTVVQVSCPRCNRVNKPGATRCADCGANLPGKPRVALAPLTTAPNLTASKLVDIESTEAKLDIMNTGDTNPERTSEIGSNADTGGLDTSVNSWLFQNPNTETETPQPSSSSFSVKLLSEKQDPIIARQCYEHTTGLLDDKEEIEYIATVDQTIQYDEKGGNYVCSVATNKRIVIYNRVATGELDLAHPDVCLWQDMDEIYFEEDPEISLRFIAISGWHVELKDLYPPQARRLYIYGVDHSERVLRNRVEQHIANQAGVPYISEPLDEGKMGRPTIGRAVGIFNPGYSGNQAQPSQSSRPRGSTGSLLDTIMRSVQASEGPTEGIMPTINVTSPNLSDPNSSQPSPVPPSDSNVHPTQQNAADTTSGGLPEGMESLTGRLPYGVEFTTGPILRPSYDPASMSGPLGNSLQTEPVAQGMPYLQPSQQPNPPQPAQSPQPAPQAKPASSLDETDVFVIRLQKLKNLVEAGLITQEDYENKKKQILEEM